MRPMKPMKEVFGATVLCVLPTSAALTCTLCHSDTARAVRAAVLGNDFYQNLGMTTLPFFILIALAAFIHGGSSR